MGIVCEIAWYWCALHGAFLLEPALCRFPSCGTDVHFKVPFFLSWLYVGFPHVVLMCTSKCLSSWADFMSVSLMWYWCALHGAFLLEPALCHFFSRALHGAFLLELALCQFPSCGTDVHFMVPFFLNWFYVGFTCVVLTCTSRCPSPAVSYQTEPSGGHICVKLRIK